MSIIDSHGPLSISVLRRSSRKFARTVEISLFETQEERQRTTPDIEFASCKIPVMKIAYLTVGLSDNVSAWSGIPYFMSKGFTENGASVSRIQNLVGMRSPALRLQEIYRRRILGENYTVYRHKKRMQYYAAQVDAIVRKMRPDVIISPSTLPIAYIQEEVPVVLWTDATFHGLLDFYPEYYGLSAKAVVEGDETERRALERCTLAIYASEWAARSAIEFYGTRSDKVCVIPMGANLDSSGDEGEISHSISERSSERCQLLLLGVDWVRKGASIAVEVATELNRRGLPTTLTIVGCNPPQDENIPEFVKVIGFVDKRSSEGMKQVANLLRDSHFLILPSRAECFGIVFAEANSFGVPALASDVGGIPSAINHGTNGLLVKTGDRQAEVAGFCDAIQSTLATPQSYRRLALSAFNEYRNKLNWKVATSTAMQAIVAKIGENEKWKTTR